RLLLSDIRWVELLEPALWRDELAEVLAAIAAAHEGEADLSALDRAAVRPQPRIRVSPQSGDHLSRLISAASYVMSLDEVQLAAPARATQARRTCRPSTAPPSARSRASACRRRAGTTSPG